MLSNKALHSTLVDVERTHDYNRLYRVTEYILYLMEVGKIERYVAFLRGINVGGHKIIKMEDLRRMFDGFNNVATYIQSGNVIFDSPEPDAVALERGIEQHLEQALDYHLAVFVRTVEQLTTIAEQAPFKDQMVDGLGMLYISFVQGEPTAETQHRVLALANEIDEYALQQREIYTFCRKDQGKSLFSNKLLEKTLGGPSTTRNWTTVNKIAQRYRPANS
jgi:uncharacterized protein (DUF1697 family)